MRRLLLVSGLALILLLVFLPQTFSEQNPSVQVSVFQQYRLNGYGFVLLNETITFANNGNSTGQIPAIQLGVPDIIATNTGGFTNETNNQFSVSSQDANGVTTFSIAPLQPALQPNAQSRLSLKAYVKNVASHNVTSAGPATQLLVLTAPSLNVQVSSLRSRIELPSGSSLRPAPPDFSSGNNNSVPFYERTQRNLQPVSSVSKFELQVGNANAFSPIEVLSVIRAVTVSPGGVPQLSDTFIVKNTGDVEINRLRLKLLPGAGTRATILPSAPPPLLDPTPVSIPDGLLDLTKKPFQATIPAGNNLSFTITYDIPSQFTKLSEGRVTVTLPYSPPIQAVVDSYEIRGAFPSNVLVPKSQPVILKNASPFSRGSVQYVYSLSIGWAAEQAIPAASLFFAITFIALFVRRGRPAETEEVGSIAGGVTSMIKAFEENVALINQSLENLISKPTGSIGKKDFDEIRGRMEAARGRAIQRLQELRTEAGSKKLVELANQIGEAEREENRASKDLVNLYEQFYTRRMRQETFDKLLPNYRKRRDDATNRLSDVLNAAQKEKQV